MPGDVEGTQKQASLPKRMFRFGYHAFQRPSVLLGLAYIIAFMGHGIWRYTFHVYAIDVLGAGPRQIGFIWSLTAVPGLFAFSVGIISKKARLSYLLIATFVMIGFGLVWIGQSGSWKALSVGALSVSIGFTFLYPIINSLCLVESRPESTASILGKLRSLGPLGVGVVGGVGVVAALVLVVPHVLSDFGFRMLYGSSGFFVLSAGIFLSVMISKHISVAKTSGRLRFSLRLWPYYALHFLSGARSALFKAFVLYLMIHDHQMEIRGTAFLVLAGNLSNFFGYRVVGFLADRYGARKTLAWVFFGVACVFVGFCFAKTKLMLSVLYLVDSLLFCSSVVTDSYLKNRVQHKELVGYLSSGVSFFYIAGVIFPIAGGLLWKEFGQTTFLLVSVLALTAIWVSRRLDEKLILKPGAIGRTQESPTNTRTR